MEKNLDQVPLGGISRFMTAGAVLVSAFVSLSLILTLWSMWAHHTSLAETVITSVFCLSFAWLIASMLRWHWNLRKLGWHAQGKAAFGLGARPELPNDLRTWRIGRQLCYSFIAVAICMVSFGILKWLSGDY
jgi:hypothetical protein